MTNPYEVVALIAAGFFYILSAGAYTFLYTYGRIVKSERVKMSSFVFTGVMLYCAYVMIGSPVFGTFWKGLLTFATVAYILILRGMWWVVVRVHRVEEEERKRKKDQPNLPVM